MEIQKGIITDYRYIRKIDNENSRNNQLIVRINGKAYTSQTQSGLNLRVGTRIIFEASGSEITSAFCPSENISWGINSGKLKRTSTIIDRYEFIEGTILEKRNFVEDFIHVNESVSYYSEPPEGFTIILHDRSFTVSPAIAKSLKPGMQIAAVLEGNNSILIADKSNNRLYGKRRPYFVLFLFMLVAFNFWMYHSQKAGKELPVSPLAMSVAVNGLLGLFTVLSICACGKCRNVKKFMQSRLKKRLA